MLKVEITGNRKDLSREELTKLILEQVDGLFTEGTEVKPDEVKHSEGECNHDTVIKVDASSKDQGNGTTGLSCGLELQGCPAGILNVLSAIVASVYKQMELDCGVVDMIPFTMAVVEHYKSMKEDK